MSEIEITQADHLHTDRMMARLGPDANTQPARNAMDEEFARHRHEARAQALEENKAWPEAVIAIMARCEALEDESANELVKAESEHAQGYWRGQKRTAKFIRRELHDLTRALRSGERKG